MSRTPFSPDEAADVAERDEFACTVDGCPNRWTSSVDAGLGLGWRKLCHAHAAVPPRMWSLVTDAQLRARADVPRELQREPVDDETVAREKARLLALRAELEARPVPITRAWANTLRERERTGAFLTKAQRKAWREVLHEDNNP